MEVVGADHAIVAQDNVVAVIAGDLVVPRAADEIVRILIAVDHVVAAVGTRCRYLFRNVGAAALHRPVVAQDHVQTGAAAKGVVPHAAQQDITARTAVQGIVSTCSRIGRIDVVCLTGSVIAHRDAAVAD